MSMDIASIEIKSKRQAYAQISKKFGVDRPASRYEEAVIGGQPSENFHYRPQWDVDNEIFDVRRTKIVMKDWEDFLDPRKFHYMSYVSARAKQNSTNMDNFEYIEKRTMISKLTQEDKKTIYKYLTPLRHYFYGANMNNLTLSSIAYGAPLGSASQFQAEDELGFAQHTTKMILDISENDISILNDGKDAWMNNPDWQGLRKAIEDSFIVKDYMELFVIQNVVFDGFIIPLMFSELSKSLSSSGELLVSMMSEFVLTVHEETNKWIDSVIKIAASESEENKVLLAQWSQKYISITQDALESLSNFTNDDVLVSIKQNLLDRLNKNGLNL